MFQRVHSWERQQQDCVFPNDVINIVLSIFCVNVLFGFLTIIWPWHLSYRMYELHLSECSFINLSICQFQTMLCIFKSSFQYDFFCMCFEYKNVAHPCLNCNWSKLYRDVVWGQPDKLTKDSFKITEDKNLKLK